jgi:hypothetical protein
MSLADQQAAMRKRMRPNPHVHVGVAPTPETIARKEARLAQERIDAAKRAASPKARMKRIVDAMARLKQLGIDARLLTLPLTPEEQRAIKKQSLIDSGMLGIAREDLKYARREKQITAKEYEQEWHMLGRICDEGGE